MSDWQKWVFASDVHGDMMSKSSVDVLFKFCKDFKPDIKVFGGDLWDFRPLRKGAGEDEKRESMAKDYSAGMMFLKQYHPSFYLRGNHCFHGDTELLTSEGWKNVKQIKRSDCVAQFDVSRKITFDYPKDIISTTTDEFIFIDGAYTKQMVTPQHDIIVDGKKCKAESIIGKKIKASSIYKSGFAGAELCAIESDWLRLLTWVCMDGTIVVGENGKKSNKARVQFKLSYQHKIDRLCALLTRLGIGYSIKPSKKSGCNVLQPYVIRFYGDDARKVVSALGGKKLLPEWFEALPPCNLKTFMEELAVTDGCEKDASIAWITVEPHNVNVVSLWCVKNGVDFRFAERENYSGFANGKKQYQCAIRFREVIQDCAMISATRISHKSNAYCVTMPLGTVISRFAGCVAFTGNCERLWELAEADNGVISDYAVSGVVEIENTLQKMRCKMLPYHKRDGVLRIGSLKMMHGFFCGINAARQHAIVYGSCLFGHVHTVDEHSIAGMDRRTARAVGALCSLDMDYSARNPTTLRQSNGFAFGLVNKKTGNYFCQQAERIDGRWMIPTEFKEYK